MPNQQVGPLDRRGSFGLIALALISFVILVAIVSLFLNLNRQEQRARESVREDATWAAYQLNNEAGQLLRAIDAAMQSSNAETLKSLSTRFDVLYSRASFLVQGHYAIKFDGDPDIAELSKRTYSAIMAMAPAFDAMVGAAQVDETQIAALVSPVMELRAIGMDLLVKTNAHINQTRVQSRADAEVIALGLAGGVAALVVAFVSIVVLMAFQLLAAARSRRALELLTTQHEKAREAAEQGNRAKSAFLAMMSHEIRTPLNGIIGMVDLLEGEETDTDKRCKLETVRQSGDILLEVINDILDFSRLESGGIDLESTSYHLDLIMDSVRSVVGPRAESKSLTVTVECPPLVLLGDAARVRQVLLNLAGNAVKFTDTGAITLRASLDTASGCVRFLVKDTGIGIAEKAQTRLFKEFSQVDSSINRRFGGSGLGLAICGRLVGAMGGEIGVSSTPNAGSDFWFTVPYAKGDESLEKLERVGRPTYVLPVERLRALLVEDNAINRVVASKILDKLGVDVTVAFNGQEACAALATATFDLVFMDMQMPVMDGLDATRRIRASGNKVTIIGLTANAFTSDREACLLSGMNDFMTKPIKRGKFESMLLKWVQAGTSYGALQFGGDEPIAPNLVDADHQKGLVAELGEDVMDDLRRIFWTDAKHQLESLERALCSNDLAAVDSVLHTVKGASYALGYVGVANAAQAARGILGLQPGFWLQELRKTMAVTFSADPPAAPRGVVDGASPAIDAASLDQFQYWQAIRMHTEIPYQRVARH